MSGRAISYDATTKTGGTTVSCYVYSADAFMHADPSEVRLGLSLSDGGYVGCRLTAAQARDLANKLNACATVAERAAEQVGA